MDCGVTLACEGGHQVKAHKMAKKLTLEEQMKALQNHFGRMVSTVKDLKASLEALERKVDTRQNDEFREILETQTVIDEVIVANSDAIQRIKQEMRGIKCTENTNKEDDNKPKHKKVECSKVRNNHPGQKEVTAETKDKEEACETIRETEVERKRKRCRYYNRGFCKYTTKCKFVHPTETCKVYLSGKICDKSDCEFRHPKICKWLESKGGCKRETCDYRHVTLACDDQNSNNSHKTVAMKCAGCKSDWVDKNHVVKHIILNRLTFFCLNCNDLIKDKTRVLEKGWTLFDEAGFLRHDV